MSGTRTSRCEGFLWSSDQGHGQQACGRFRIGWSSEEERAEANAYEDEEADEIDGLLRTHECKPPHR